MLANVMFELPVVQAATQARSGAAQWLSEFVATAGLILVAFRAPTLEQATLITLNNGDDLRFDAVLAPVTEPTTTTSTTTTLPSPVT